MFKQSLIAFVAAGLVSVAMPFATAQSNDQQAPPSQENGMRRHGPMDPAERTRELTRQLKLTSDQQTKVQDIYESARSQMESVHHDSSLSQDERHSKMMEIHKNADAQVRGLLDSNQQKKWDEMQARHEQMRNGRQGPPDAGSGQQPPQ
jgi:Spy/CpxP family protein refolding chaperone